MKKRVVVLALALCMLLTLAPQAGAYEIEYPGSMENFMDMRWYVQEWQIKFGEDSYPEEYALLDIDQDGYEELFVRAEEYGGWNILVFEYGLWSDQVSRLEFPEYSGNYELFSYTGSLSYSPSNRYLIYTDESENHFFYSKYGSLGGVFCMYYGFAANGDPCYKAYGEYPMTQEEYDFYMGDAQPIEFQPLSAYQYANPRDYRVVLDQYKEAIASDFSGEVGEYVDEQADFYHNYGNFYYALTDVSGDGREELLIGTGDGERIEAIDLYTLDRGHAVHIMDETSFGYRAHLYILADNRLYYTGSSGAADNTAELLRLAPGQTYARLEEGYYSGYNDYDGYVFHYTDSSGTLYTVSRGTYQAGIDNWAELPRKPLNWHRITQDSWIDPFVDVSEDHWFYEDVLWAVEEGITTGVTSTTFEPDSTCTRDQVVTFLWRAAGSPEPVSDSNPFVDVNQEDYFHKAVLWAVEKGITNGVDLTHFAPGKACTRAEVVTFLYRFAQEPSFTAGENPFADVKPGQWFYDNVLWAVGEGITNGTTPTTFEPDSTCTRAQIVTFLHRAVG